MRCLFTGLKLRMRIDANSVQVVKQEEEDGEEEDGEVKVKQEPREDDINALRAGQLRQSQDERVNSALKELYNNSSPNKDESPSRSATQPPKSEDAAASPWLEPALMWPKVQFLAIVMV